LLGYEERLTLFDGDGEVLPWVRAAASPGHSPWHCSYIIGSGPGACLFLGDVAHKAHLQMAHPDCAFAYDHDPVMAKQTRAAPMGRAADEGFSVIG
jgi:glyoxylase-like metal-dependent hydrolase (beta-lactamase superfamily II)